MPAEQHNLIDLTTEIVSAYVANNPLPNDQLSGLIQQVYNAVAGLGRQEQPEEPKAQPAVPIRRSVKPHEIVCLECGRGQKMLKRHLLTAHGLTPEEYRAKWSLPSDYPVVAPDYAKLRSQFAKQIGLGRKKEEERPAKGKAGQGVAKPRNRRRPRAAATGE